MKIKAVHKRGRKRGEPVEYEPQEKIPLAVQDAVVDHFDGRMCWVRNVVLGKFTHTIKGNPLKRKWQNNVYDAEGTADFNFREIKTGHIRPKKTLKFKIKFEDCLDYIGQPDLKVLKFETK